MNNNPINTLRTLKAMGYEDFEIYGFDSNNLTYSGYEASKFKSILDDLNLTASCGHYGFSDYFMAPENDLRHFMDQCIKGAKALKTPFITWPWMAPEFRTIYNYKLLAQKLNSIGEQINNAGLGFAYHHQGYEFEDHNRESGYDIIINETDSNLVKLQLDLYWVMHAGNITPKELIHKYPRRFVKWHIKDMDKVTRDYTELGNGSINYLEILPDPEISGSVYYYIGQGGNFTNSPLKSAEISIIYLKKNLLEYL